MGLKEWIIPQDKHFFNMLENESQNVLDGSNAFLDMLKNYENIKEKQQKIKDIEHQGDDFVHEIFEELNKTFITPIDHEDISALASAFDDVLDYIDGTATRLVLYEIERPENVADDIYKSSVAQLFKQKDAIEIMKLKEIYERLEFATDKCEDAANVISDIVVKNS